MEDRVKEGNKQEILTIKKKLSEKNNIINEYHHNLNNYNHYAKEFLLFFHLYPM